MPIDTTPVASSANALSETGEVSGLFLLGLIESFCHVDVFPEGEVWLPSGQIDPDKWYPHGLLITILNRVEQLVPSSQNIFFRAGVNFLRSWYEQGAGKTMIHSTMDWLYANKESGGYNTVVRGGTPDEIGWCLLQTIDEAAGIAIYENVMPLHPDFIRGVFFGGCVLFDDVEFVDVESTSEPYAPNPAFRNTIITVRFRLKPEQSSQDLEARLDGLQLGERLALTAAETESLVWRYKGLKIRNLKDADYFNDISDILTKTISERKQAERELAAYRNHLETLVKIRTAELATAMEAAQTANVAKSAFLANMSHEMRTPLHQISGLAKLVRSDPMTPKQTERMDKLDLALRHMTSVVGAILDLTKLEADKLQVEEGPVSIDDLLRDVETSLYTKVDAKGLQFKTEAVKLSTGLLGDPEKIRSALLNFAENAIRFTEAGHVAIRVRLQEEDTASALLRFEVEDTGIGIAPEVLPRLFNVFEQADNSMTRKYGGAGIGLFFTKKLAQLMSGDTGCESTLGKGSTFWFTVRLKKQLTAAS